ERGGDLVAGRGVDRGGRPAGRLGQVGDGAVLVVDVGVQACRLERGAGRGGRREQVQAGQVVGELVVPPFLVPPLLAGADPGEDRAGLPVEEAAQDLLVLGVVGLRGACLGAGGRGG